VGNSSGREPERFWLAMDDGELVEVDGSTVLDEESGREVPAVVLRMPLWRAHSLGHVLSDWSAVVDRVGDVDRGSLHEGELGWALFAAAGVAGHRDAVVDAERRSSSVSSGQRARAAAVLRDRYAFDLRTLIAVVDAAAWWLDEPNGDTYASALLVSVTGADRETAGEVYLALVGEPEDGGDEGERSG
jgi:hypothetical protein